MTIKWNGGQSYRISNGEQLALLAAVAAIGIAVIIIIKKRKGQSKA